MKDKDSRAELQSGISGYFVPFPEFTWIRGGISMKSDGGMSWDNEPEPLIAERRDQYFLKHQLNISSGIAADQIHGTCVHVASSMDSGRGMTQRASRVPETDGLITDESGLVLATLHADCAPVFFANTHSRRIGLAHCGWRGTLAGLPGIMMQAMSEAATQARQSVHVAIGPSISTLNYEFGEREADLFVERYGPTVVAIRGGKYHLDLCSAIVINLLENGLKPSTIPARPPCTFADKRFASFRRDGSPTRSMMAWLTKVK